jgi:syntaxin 7
MDSEFEYNKIKFKKIDNENEIENEIIINEEIAKEKEIAINQIHKDIIQIHEIFADLANIVNEQEISIDITTNNIDESLKNTKCGLENIKNAAKSQRTCNII